MPLYSIERARQGLLKKCLPAIQGSSVNHYLWFRYHHDHHKNLLLDFKKPQMFLLPTCPLFAILTGESKLRFLFGFSCIDTSLMKSQMINHLVGHCESRFCLHGRFGSWGLRRRPLLAPFGCRTSARFVFADCAPCCVKTAPFQRSKKCK